MTDNTTLNPGRAGDVIATDDIAAGVAAGAKVQRVKVGWGRDGIYRDVDNQRPIPVRPPLSLFDEAISVERFPVIELKSIYGLSRLRDVWTETGSATVTNNESEYVLATTAASGDKALLESAERGRYIAGQSAECGIGVRSDDTPTGDAAMEWGYFDDPTSEGFGFGLDAGGYYIWRNRGGTREDKIYQADWVGEDKLDGNGETGVSLDISDGLIFQIMFSWYGYGVIEYRVVVSDADAFPGDARRQITVVVHRSKVAGGVSVLDPNLPVSARVDNGTTAEALTLYVAGRQFSTVGRFSPNRRVTTCYRLNVSCNDTDWTPILSMRLKSGKFQSIAAKINSINIITSANAIVQVRLGSTLTTPTWEDVDDHDPDETALECDTSATTAVTDGDPLQTKFVSASGAVGNRVGNIDVPVPEITFSDQVPMTIVVKGFPTTSPTVSAILSVSEEW